MRTRSNSGGGRGANQRRGHHHISGHLLLAAISAAPPSDEYYTDSYGYGLRRRLPLGVPVAVAQFPIHVLPVFCIRSDVVGASRR